MNQDKITRFKKQNVLSFGWVFKCGHHPVTSLEGLLENRWIWKFFVENHKFFEILEVVTYFITFKRKKKVIKTIFFIKK